MIHNILLEHYRDSVIGLEGPTGSGKTLGMLSFIKTFPEKHGNVLMIFPNQFVINRVRRYLKVYSPIVNLMNPTLGLTFFLQHRDQIDTIIVDEAHFVSKEYETFMRTLKYFYYQNLQQYKLYFISATLNRVKLVQNFPNIKFLSLQPSIFPVSIEYEDFNFWDNPSHQLSGVVMDSIGKNIMENFPNVHSRIIVFLASHEQCEKYCKYLSQKGINNCFVLYSNLNDEQYVLTEKQIFNPTTSFVLFCTNIAETAITVPNVSLVMDLCVVYKKQNNMLIIDWCDQSSLIQRAGRTGRTCPGQVIRYISKEHYKKLPIHQIPSFSWEKSCLSLISVNLNPIEILGPEVNEAIFFLQSKGILDFYKTIKNNDLAQFCLNSPLDIDCSTLLWKLKQGKNYNVTETLLITLAISLINLMETQNVNFLYTKNFKKSNHFVVALLERLFKEKDELCVLLSIFLTVFLSNNPVKLANELNLNFKTFRIWCSQFENCLKILSLTSTPWKNVLSNMKVYEMCSDKKIYTLDDYRQHISKFLYNNTSYTIHFSLGLFTTASLMDMKMIKIDLNTNFSHFLVLVNKRVQSIPHPLISLFIYPYHLDFGIEELENGLETFIKNSNIKNSIKALQSNFLTEIREIIAYQPGKIGMEQTIEEWTCTLNAWNSKITCS